MVLHVTPSSYRVYLSLCEVWVLKRPLKLEDGCHKSARGLSDVHACGWLLLRHALGAECHGGQQQASCALSVTDAELVQPQWAGVLQRSLRPAQAVVRVPRWALYPASARPCSRSRI